jgi:hypothetical protein
MGSVGFGQKGNRKMASDAADGKPFGRPFVLWRERWESLIGNRGRPTIQDDNERLAP